MEISVIDPLNDDQWNRLVDGHPDATVFHRSEWAHVLCETYGHRTRYIRVGKAGSQVALVPLMGVESWLTGRRGVSLPFTDRCGPLWLGAPDGRLIDSLARFSREQGWRTFEIRDEIPGVDSSVEYAGHVLNLSTVAEMRQNLHASLRQGIRKAESNEVTVGIDRSLQAVKTFYNLHVSTRRRHGAPPQPFRFFRNIQARLFARNMGFVATASHRGRPVASAVFFQSGLHGIYKFGASDLSVQHLRANALVMWRGIEELVASGARRLEFGRTTLANAGLRRFKRHWGGKETRIRYARFDARTAGVLPGVDRSEGWQAACFRVLPPAVNRLAGDFLYGHLD